MGYGWERGGSTLLGRRGGGQQSGFLAFLAHKGRMCALAMLCRTLMEGQKEEGVGMVGVVEGLPVWPCASHCLSARQTFPKHMEVRPCQRLFKMLPPSVCFLSSISEYIPKVFSLCKQLPSLFSLNSLPFSQRTVSATRLTSARGVFEMRQWTTRNPAAKHKQEVCTACRKRSCNTQVTHTQHEPRQDQQCVLSFWPK